MRVHDVLGRQPKHTVEDSKALQTDSFTLPAHRLKPILAELKSTDANTARALDMLRHWDCRLLAESGPAALFELWWSTHLKPAFFAQLVPNAEIRALLMTPGDVESIVSAIEKPAARFGSQSARDQLLLSTLGSAYGDAVKRMGADPGAWQWGRLHQGFFSHALAALPSASHIGEVNVGPLPKGGGDSTPMMAAYRPSDFRVYLGASVRLVVDVGDWDKSVWINAPGQSGDPQSPHYRDLAPLWAKGDYVPMPYSEDAVAKVIERRILLDPAAR
jgi:penicillin amidase